MINQLGVDANILFEIYLGRENKQECLETLDNYNSQNITSLTTHIFNYYGEKWKIDYQNLNDYIGIFEIIDFKKEDYQRALTFYDGKDFEDCLQVSMFLNNGVDKFFTLDKELKSRFGKFIEIITL